MAPKPAAPSSVAAGFAFAPEERRNFGEGASLVIVRGCNPRAGTYENALASLVGLSRKAWFELLEVRSQLLPRYDEAVSRTVHSTNEVRHDSG